MFSVCLGSYFAYDWKLLGVDRSLYSGDPLGSYTQSSKFHCAVMCVRHPRCFGFDFTPQNQLCEIHSADNVTEDAGCGGGGCQPGTKLNFGKYIKVNVYIYSPDIPVYRLSGLDIIYCQVLELTL